MKKARRLLMSVFLFIGLFISSGYIHAKSLDPSDYITSAEINPKTFDNGKTITITYHYKDNEPDIKGGDTMYIPLPKSPVYVEGYQSSQLLKNSKGVPMATMNVSHDGITLTFLDSVDNMQPDTITGTMTVYASVYANDSSSDSGKPVEVPLVPGGDSTSNPTITITKPSSSSSDVVDVGGKIIPTDVPHLEKSSYSNKDNVESWQLIASVSSLTDGILKDNVGPDLTIDPSSIVVTPINGGKNSGLTGGTDYSLSQLQSMGVLNATVTDKEIDIKFDSEKNQGIVYQIRYNTKSTYDNTNPYYQNRAEIAGKDSSGAPFEKTVVATAKNENASGSITGTNQSGITFQKVDSSTLEPVPGAKFEIASDKGFTQNTETGTTSSDGMLSFGHLNDGTYYIKEVSAPSGYQLNSNVYHFTITDGVASGLMDSTGNQLPTNTIYEQQNVSFSFKKVSDSGEPLANAVFQLTNNLTNQSQMTISDDSGEVEFSGLEDGTYTLSEVVAPSGYTLSNKTYTVTVSNGKVTTTLPSNNEFVDNKSSLSSSSSLSSKKSSSSSIKSSSSSKKSSSSSIKSSSSSKKSSSLVKSSSSSKKSSSSSIKSSSSSKKSSSLVKSSSSSKKATVASSSSKKSSSSSIKSSSSSKKSSSLVKSSSSSKKSSSSLIKSSSSSKKSSSSSIKSLSSSKKSSSSSVKSSSSSKKSSCSSIKSLSSSKKSSSSSIKSSSSSKKATVASSSSKKATVASSSSKEATVVSNSTNKSSQNTETSVKVPSKASTISYVNKSTQVSVPVVVSSKANTMVESSISSEINNGSSSVSIVNKPTLVSSSMDISVRSWSNSIKDESSAVVTETSVSTYSRSKFVNKDVNKSTSNTATTQNTAVINNTNSHSTNQGGVAVAGNNNNDNNAQGNKSGKGNNRGEGLPQTGEVAATAVIGLGVVLIAVSGLVILKKKNS